MLKVLLFAKLREQVGWSERQWDWAAGMTAAELREHIAAAAGESAREALFADNTLVAVNQAFADWETPLNDGDEVALYPPVTGG